MDETITQLKESLLRIEEQLKTASDDDRQALQVEIGQKSAAIDAMASQQQRQHATLEEEIAALKRDARETDIKRAAQDAAQQIAAGMKSDPQDLAALVAEHVKKAIAGSETEPGIKGLIADALGEFRTGRKTPAEGGTSEGSAGGGAYIPQHRLGEKDTFGTFLLAVGRKDNATIADMQRSKGVRLGVDGWSSVNGYRPYLAEGAKALVEGQGANDAVAGPSGGYVVPVEYSTDIIPLLYPYTTLRRAGARVMTMRSPSFRQPRLAGGSTASYVGETAAIPTSQETFSQFSLQAKELTAMVPVSRFLVQDSDPNIEQIVKDDMAMQIGLKEDITFLTGTGSATVPQGILTASGTTQIAATGGNGDAPTFKMITGMLTQLRKANVPNINRVWIGPPDLQNALLNVTDGNARPIFAEFNNPSTQNVFTNNAAGNANTGPDGVLMGLPYYSTTQLPLGTTGSGATASLALVEMSQVVIGQLGGLEIDASAEASYVDGSANTLSAWQSNLIVYRAVMRHDVATYHPSAVIYRAGIVYS